MPDQTLELEVTLENGKFKVASKEVNAQVKKTGDVAQVAGEKGKTGFGKLTGGMKAFAAAAKATVILALVAGFVKLIKTSLSSAAAMEKQEIALSTMLKSGDKAKSLLRDITSFAASTPFQLPGLIEASKRLLAFGVAQEEIIPTLRNLGNAAGGNAETLDRLTLAYGKLKAKGRASLDEINMFTEAGVPLLDALEKQFGVTGEELSKMISTGKVGFPDVQEAIENLTTGSGKFAGMLERQSMSLSGLLSTLKDKLGLLALDMGQKLSPAFKNIVKSFLDGTDSGGAFTQMLSNVAWVLGKTVNGLALLIRSISFLVTNVERGLIKVQKIKFELRHGVSEDLIRQNQGNIKYGEYIELLEREQVLKSESQRRGAAVLEQARELLGLNEKVAEVEEKRAEAEKKIAARKGAGGGGKGGKGGNKEFEEKQKRLLEYHDLKFTKEDQALQDERARQNQAAQDYEAHLRTKLGLDSVYYAGLQTVANTAAVFMAEKNKKLFRFGQVLAIAQSWINTFQGMTKAYAQLGPIGGPIGAGVIMAAGVLSTRKIASQKAPEFAVGSFNVPSTSPAIVHQGEMILPKTMAESVRSGDAVVSSGGGQQPMIIQVDGKTLFEVNEQHRDEAVQNIGSTGSFPIDSPY